MNAESLELPGGIPHADEPLKCGHEITDLAYACSRCIQADKTRIAELQRDEEDMRREYVCKERGFIDRIAELKRQRDGLATAAVEVVEWNEKAYSQVCSCAWCEKGRSLTANLRAAVAQAKVRPDPPGPAPSGETA